VATLPGFLLGFARFGNPLMEISMHGILDDLSQDNRSRLPLTSF
jgi:hypothetical protein